MKSKPFCAISRELNHDRTSSTLLLYYEFDLGHTYNFYSILFPILPLLVSIVSDVLKQKNLKCKTVSPQVHFSHM